ncbi:MAG: HAMP domain-containing protein [Alphaproteobacteria bacterium]|nr:HAMP domain-containing protein [Alphaproteobacteria bacterium]MBV8412229.1 HAMP domain-containing protein [Alphaproteobacteria bacterium]
MASADTSASAPSARRSLAVKLFAVLLLLSGGAVLVTSVMGYLQARDALEDSIYNALTIARKGKARQVEAYFHNIRNDLVQLAASKMVLEASRAFRSGFDELDKQDVSTDLRSKLAAWYEAQFMPQTRRLLAKDVSVDEFLPSSAAGIYLQYYYIAANPHPEGMRDLLDDAGDGSAWSREHAIYHPLLRAASSGYGFEDLMLVDPHSGHMIYSVEKDADFATSVRTGPYRSSKVSTAVARCSAATDRTTVCFEDFAPYLPSNGDPEAFMAVPVFDQGVIIAVLIAQLHNEDIDAVVNSDRQWRQEGYGISGEAYLVGADHLLRSAPRAFFENRDQYFAELKAGGESQADIDAIERYGTPILHQRIDTQAVQSALAGVEGTGEIIGHRGAPVLASWGPLAVLGTRWALVAKIDSAEAFAPVDRLRRELLIASGVALVLVIATGAWLSRSLLGPLRELTAGVTRFAAGDYGAQVAVRTRDEIGALCAAFNGMVGQLRDKNAVIENKNRENEALLLNVLPAPIANRLRGGEQSIADGFAEVTVAFADIVGFTAMSSDMPPAEVVTLLNGLFSRFDQAAHELDIEKIKTVGDAYMAVCGLPVQVPDHAARMMRMAIRMVHITREHAMEHRVAMKLRVGVNSGPVVAGVIGKSKYIYDLWGDTVNLASRMESGGIPDTIQVTRPVYEKLKDEFAFEPRGVIEVKGKGQVEAWLLRL